MGQQSKSVRLAAVQYSPAFLDLEGSIDKSVALILEAGRGGADASALVPLSPGKQSRGTGLFKATCREQHCRPGTRCRRIVQSGPERRRFRRDGMLRARGRTARHPVQHASVHRRRWQSGWAPPETCADTWRKIGACARRCRRPACVSD
jgi:hypothetical protein